MKTIVFRQIKRSNERGFTFIEVLSQLIVLALVVSLLPIITIEASQWRSAKAFHEEVEWEYTANAILKLLQQYDYYSTNNRNNYRISLYTEERIQNYDGPTFAAENAVLLVSDASVILSKNTGTEPIVYSKAKYSLVPLDDGFILKQYNASGDERERRFYMKRIYW